MGEINYNLSINWEMYFFYIFASFVLHLVVFSVKSDFVGIKAADLISSEAARLRFHRKRKRAISPGAYGIQIHIRPHRNISCDKSLERYASRLFAVFYIFLLTFCKK